MSIIMTEQGWQQLEPTVCTSAPKDDGRYRGPLPTEVAIRCTEGFNLYMDGKLSWEGFLSRMTERVDYSKYE